MLKRSIIILVGVLFTVGLAQTAQLTFVNHLQAGMNEQDIYVEHEAGSANVFRAVATDEDMSAMLYTSAAPVKHNPASAEDIGPFSKGMPLNITLGEWLAGTGTATFSCNNGQGSLEASFDKLIPNSVYTLWHFFMPLPPTTPFQSIDLPVGARDGSQNVLRSDASGHASYSVSFDTCLPFSMNTLASALALAYHSNDVTYGLEPGNFGTVSHVQLLVFFPTAEQALASD